jgi:hypothetical protein
MQEFLLPAALVGVVAIAALSPTSGTLFDYFFQAQTGQIYSAKNKSVHLQPMGTLTPSQALGVSTQTLRITLEDGSILTLNQLPSNLKEAIESLGSNGTTELLLANLDSLIVQMEKAGASDPAQLNRLKALSNQGHRLARIQEALEQAFTQAQAQGIPFPETSVTFDGVTYKPPTALSLQIGFGVTDMNGAVPSSPEFIQFMRSTGYYGTDTSIYERHPPGAELAQFYQELQRATQSGALNQPAVRQVVVELSNRIAAVSDGLEGGLHRASEEISLGKPLSVERLRSLSAIDASHHYSGEICQVDGGRDSGVQCLD